ncbi:MAG: putative nucleotidyltransferase substrate binding domain-containing protein [Gammaproteobacteria bacterium]|nr:putative nucleotidyltransferase substrate binding domain-containing protein [Gammaproteobacteria bacterium]
MEIELIEILDALRRYPPFNSLDDETLESMVNDIQVQYVRASNTVMEAGQENQHLYFIRSGAVEVRMKSGELYARAGEGELFGHISLIRHGRSAYTVTTLEDSLFYLIPSRWFERLQEQNEHFSEFFELAEEQRLHTALTRARESNDVSLMTCHVSELIQRQPVMVEADVNIREAARTMAGEGVSSLLIMRDGRLAGIVTDRDLRNRVIAAGAGYDDPVESIMTENPVTGDRKDFAFKTMLTMMRNNVHHIPILHNRHPVGVVSVSDIVQYESHGSVYLIADLFKQQDVAGLKEISSRLPQTFAQLVRADANSAMIGNAISHVGVTIIQRLLQLGEEQLGPPPVPYCFLALGSQAREEQIIKTDQDNAMVLDDRFDAARHDEYFKALAKFVSDGLNECGYVYCPGDIMATNDQWRQPLAVWKETFNDWINKPNGEALLRSSIFFDLRGIHGETRFADELLEFISENTLNNKSFLAHMAHNATRRKPPLGFFRQFVVEKSGEHSKSINLKARGVAPVIDTVRVHALGCGSRKANTFDRLKDVAQSSLLTEGKANDLIDALELIGMVRIRHQAAQIEAGKPPDNYVQPDMLSTFERRHLKDAFQIASRMQEFLKYRYTARRTN